MYGLNLMFEYEHKNKFVKSKLIGVLDPDTAVSTWKETLDLSAEGANSDPNSNSEAESEPASKPNTVELDKEDENALQFDKEASVDSNQLTFMVCLDLKSRVWFAFQRIKGDAGEAAERSMAKALCGEVDSKGKGKGGGDGDGDGDGDDESVFLKGLPVRFDLGVQPFVRLQSTGRG